MLQNKASRIASFPGSLLTPMNISFYFLLLGRGESLGTRLSLLISFTLYTRSSAVSFGMRQKCHVILLTRFERHKTIWNYRAAVVTNLSEESQQTWSTRSWLSWLLRERKHVQTLYEENMFGHFCTETPSLIPRPLFA